MAWFILGSETNWDYEVPISLWGWIASQFWLLNIYGTFLQYIHAGMRDIACRDTISYEGMYGLYNAIMFGCRYCLGSHQTVQMYLMCLVIAIVHTYS